MLKSSIVHRRSSINAFDLSLLPSRAAMLKGVRRSDLSRLFISGPEWSSAQTVENIRRLQIPDSVAVVATVEASLFGGSVAQYLKCMTAIKASEELEKRSISAIPVCCVKNFIAESNCVVLLDNDGDIHRISFNGQPDVFSPIDNEAPDLISKIEALGRGAYDPEVIAMMRSAYSPRTSISTASARIFSSLMKEWGLVVLDPELSFSESIPEPILAEAHNMQLSEEACMFLFQSSVLPVIADVVDADDSSVLTTALPLFEKLNLVKPIEWPSSSATFVDSKSRKTLEKYNLEIADLLAGETETMIRIKRDLPNSSKISTLRSIVERTMDELERLMSADDEFLKNKGASREKIIYQLDKLQKNLETAKLNRLQSATRQVHRACSFLAPGGNPQESELAGIYFLLRYSCAALRNIYERLNGMAQEHQIILMD